MADFSKLNDRQRRFAELIVAGSTAKAAYFEAFPRCKRESTAMVEGSKLFRNPKVQEFIKELRAEVCEKSATSLTLTMAERREFLAELIQTPVGKIDETSRLAQSVKWSKDGREVRVPDKLRAIELDAKLAGELKDQPAPAEGITIVISQGTLPALQHGYRELQTHGRN